MLRLIISCQYVQYGQNQISINTCRSKELSKENTVTCLWPTKEQVLSLLVAETVSFYDLADHQPVEQNEMWLMTSAEYDIMGFP